MVCLLWLCALHRVTLHRGAGSTPSQVQKLELVTFVVMRERVSIILENENHWIQLLFWWIYWMSSYLGWKQGLFSNAYIHNRCAETASLTPTAQLGQTAPLNLCQLPHCSHSTALSSFPLMAGDVWRVLMHSHLFLLGEKQRETPLLLRCWEPWFKNKTRISQYLNQLFFPVWAAGRHKSRTELWQLSAFLFNRKCILKQTLLCTIVNTVFRSQYITEIVPQLKNRLK